MDEVKKHHEHLFRYKKKYSQELLNWWKQKYPTKWNDFVYSVVPFFKKNFEIVMKYRLWALDGNKDEFLTLAEKYLPYWRKTMKYIYGQDIHDQLCSYFHNESRYKIDFWGEDVDYIKMHVSSNQEIEIWQRELQDMAIWDLVYNENYQEHYSIRSMYTSLREDE